MGLFKQALTKTIAVFFIAVPALTSCDRLHEDLDPCPQGLRLRFVYEYNMEFANAFPSQVDCLNLYVYDKEGNWVCSRTATKDQTSNENWRMDIDLPAGEYRMLAYGGVGCQDASFYFLSNPETTPMEDIELQLKSTLITRPEGKLLHPLFYGQLEVTVPPSTPGSNYTEATVYMMKDTNNIRLVLANSGGLPTDEADFTFSITDNNNLFNWDNDIISTDMFTYCPWTKGNTMAGVLPNLEPAKVAFAEFSTSRLMENADARLIVKNNETQENVIDVDLINILMLYKSERYSSMPPQEFLDRESEWNMTFFLTDNGRWADAMIVVNDWVVRINDIED